MTQEFEINQKMVRAVEDILWREFGPPSEIGTAHWEYAETAMEILESAFQKGGARYAVSSECLSLSALQDQPSTE